MSRKKAKANEEAAPPAPVETAPETGGDVDPAAELAPVEPAAAPEPGPVDDGGGQRDGGDLAAGGQPEAPAPDLTPALEIASKSRAGIRRAGLWHGPEPVLHEAGSLSVGQIADIEAEPGLIVRRVEPAKPIGARQN